MTKDVKRAYETWIDCKNVATDLVAALWDLEQADTADSVEVAVERARAISKLEAARAHVHQMLRLTEWAAKKIYADAGIDPAEAESTMPGEPRVLKQEG